MDASLRGILSIVVCGDSLAAGRKLAIVADAICVVAIGTVSRIGNALSLDDVAVETCSTVGYANIVGCSCVASARAIHFAFWRGG